MNAYEPGTPRPKPDCPYCGKAVSAVARACCPHVKLHQALRATITAMREALRRRLAMQGFAVHPESTSEFVLAVRRWDWPEGRRER